MYNVFAESGLITSNLNRDYLPETVKELLKRELEKHENNPMHLLLKLNKILETFKECKIATEQDIKLKASIETLLVGDNEEEQCIPYSLSSKALFVIDREGIPFINELAPRGYSFSASIKEYYYGEYRDRENNTSVENVLGYNISQERKKNFIDEVNMYFTSLQHILALLYTELQHIDQEEGLQLEEKQLQEKILALPAFTGVENHVRDGSYVTKDDVIECTTEQERQMSNFLELECRHIMETLSVSSYCFEQRVKHWRQYTYKRRG